MASENLIDELLEDARERMAKSVESTQHEFGDGAHRRASPALLDRIVVDYYGAMTPLKQLATISAPEARLLTCSRTTRARSRRSRRRSTSPTSA
jgi:ribosome recycling factor